VSAPYKRPDGRAFDALRPIEITVGVSKFAEGSCEIRFGDTEVLCLATVDDTVPRHLIGKDQGWVTAEYAMLPRSSPERIERERRGPGGRSQEIQRLIGRSLRAVVDMDGLGERSILVDCDVLNADAGTRTASITGGYVALVLALDSLREKRLLDRLPLTGSVAAVSVGLCGGKALLDLCYEEDHRAEVDFNVVMTGNGRFVEVQGTAEGKAFTQAQLDRLLALARAGIERLTAMQRETLREAGIALPRK
jgi:ribonuclease PH